ncbi:UNVERIFIED_ORG: hypothetical protein GGI57_001535 [Rhizobium aethiopicum]
MPRRAAKLPEFIEQKQSLMHVLAALETVKTDDGELSALIAEADQLAALLMQRKPTWLVEVSSGSAWRAAGR